MFDDLKLDFVLLHFLFVAFTTRDYKNPTDYKLLRVADRIFFVF